jgi:hypothetical protein
MKSNILLLVHLSIHVYNVCIITEVFNQRLLTSFMPFKVVLKRIIQSSTAHNYNQVFATFP